MNDRELLALAAKASTLRIETPDDDDGVFVIREKNRNGFVWNPLESDGDALRLAVKLGMNLEITDSNVYACCRGNCSENAKPDPNAALRRAIVRAAAEVGRDTR